MSTILVLDKFVNSYSIEGGYRRGVAGCSVSPVTDTANITHEFKAAPWAAFLYTDIEMEKSAKPAISQPEIRPQISACIQDMNDVGCPARIQVTNKTCIIY